MAARPPYSRTFIAQSIPATGATIVNYVVPPGFVAIVGSVSFVQNANNAITILAASVDLTGSANFSIFYQQNFPVLALANSRGAGYWQGRITVPAGGTIRAQTLGSTVGYAVVAGYLLTAQP